MGYSVLELLHEDPSPLDEKSGDQDRSNRRDSGPDDVGSVGVEEEMNQLLPEVDHSPGSRQAASSVRTTFKLSTTAIQLFVHLSDQMGKSQKSLLDDVLDLSRESLEKNPEGVQEAASFCEEAYSPSTKSMAIALETRTGLNELAAQVGLRRDLLVEVGIRLVKHKHRKIVEEKIHAHQDILEDLKALYSEVEDVQVALSSHDKRTRSGSRGAAVEYEDPVEACLFRVMGAVDCMIQSVEESVESGVPIQEDRSFL